MFPFDLYPYINMNDLNLDWIIKMIKELHKEMDTYTALNTISWGGTWDIGKAYKQWTIVEDSGNGYISIQPVPRNVPITDTDYWVMVADYSALYAAFAQRITDLENAVTNIDNVEIPALQGDISALDGRLDVIEPIIDNLPMKNVIILTDSYGSRVNGNGDKVTDVLTAWGVNFVDIRIVSGGSFTDSNPAKKWYNYVNLYTGDHDKVSDFIFAGTINEGVYTYSDIVTETVATIQYAKSCYPNARIHIFPWGVDMANSALNEAARNLITIAYQAAAKYTGAIVAANARNILKNTSLLESDLVHPAAEGVNQLARCLYSYCRGQRFDVDYLLDITPTFHADGAVVSNVVVKPIRMKRHNDNVLIEFDYAPFRSLEFVVNSPAAGAQSFGYMLDVDETLLSYSSTSSNYKDWIAAPALGRDYVQNQINAATLYLKFVGRYIMVQGLGNIYGNAYDKFFLAANTFSITD